MSIDVWGIDEVIGRNSIWVFFVVFKGHFRRMFHFCRILFDNIAVRGTVNNIRTFDLFILLWIIVEYGYLLYAYPPSHPEIILQPPHISVFLLAPFRSAIGVCFPLNLDDQKRLPHMIQVLNGE